MGITYPHDFCPGRNGDNLSTRNEDNFTTYPPDKNAVDNLSTANVDKFCDLSPV